MHGLSASPFPPPIWSLPRARDTMVSPWRPPTRISNVSRRCGSAKDSASSGIAAVRDAGTAGLETRSAGWLPAPFRLDRDPLADCRQKQGAPIRVHVRQAQADPFGDYTIPAGAGPDPSRNASCLREALPGIVERLESRTMWPIPDEGYRDRTNGPDRQPEDRDRHRPPTVVITGHALARPQPARLPKRYLDIRQQAPSQDRTVVLRRHAPRAGRLNTAAVRPGSPPSALDCNGKRRPAAA